MPSSECNSPGSPLKFSLSCLVFVLVQQGAHQHPRLWGESRRLRDAPGSLVNHFFRRYDRWFSSFSAMNETAPRKLEEKEIVTDGLAALAKRYQPSKVGFHCQDRGCEWAKDRALCPHHLPCQRRFQSQETAISARYHETSHLPVAAKMWQSFVAVPRH